MSGLVALLVAELRSDPRARAALVEALRATDPDREPAAAGRLLTAVEAAAMVGYHPKTLVRAAAAGRVAGARRVGGRWRFDPCRLAVVAPADAPLPGAGGRASRPSRPRQPTGSAAAAAIRRQSV